MRFMGYLWGDTVVVYGGIWGYMRVSRVKVLGCKV